MWDLPRPGLEPVSPALAGRFSTTAPPGKPYSWDILQMALPQTLLYMFFDSKLYIFLLGMYLGVQYLWSYLFKTTKEFSKVVAPIYIPSLLPIFHIVFSVWPFWWVWSAIFWFLKFYIELLLHFDKSCNNRELLYIPQGFSVLMQSVYQSLRLWLVLFCDFFKIVGLCLFFRQLRKACPNN